MSILFPEDILTFGKNKGEKLSVVYKFQPSYIEWAIENIDSFKIDISAFENLPKPTPFFYNEKGFSSDKINKGMEDLSSDDWNNLIIKSDSINQLKQANVGFLKELGLDKNFSFKEIDYKFPKRIVKLNNEKLV